MNAIALTPPGSTINQSNPLETASLPKVPRQEDEGGVLEALKVIPEAGLDWAGRAAEAADWAVTTLPKAIFEQAKHIPIPGAGWLGETVGTIASGISQCLVHGPSLGALKWLQWLRRADATNSAVDSTIANDGEIGSLTVNSYLAGIKDKELARDLGEYFKLSDRLRQVDQAEGLSGQARAVERAPLTAAIARLEVTLSRRAELLELKRLAGLEGQLEEQSRQIIESRAENLAALMVTKAENHYKERLGILGAKVSTGWSAEEDHAQREALRARIRSLLLEAYTAERNNQDASGYTKQIKAELAEAFLVKSTLKQAGFFAVLGVLMHTGALSDGVQWGLEHAGDAAAWVGHKLFEWAPSWMQELITQAAFYAKAALATVGGYFGWKAASGVHNAIGGSGHVHGDAAHAGDGGAVHAQDAARSPLADVRAEADAQGALANQAAHRADAAVAAARQAVDPSLHGVDAHTAGGSVRIDPAVHRVTHGELRAGDVQGGMHPSIGKVEFRVTPR